MRTGHSCVCTLCKLEAHLVRNMPMLGETTFSYLDQSANCLPGGSSVSDLLILLRSSPAGPQSDKLLAHLLNIRAARPELVETLLVLSFIPMLHRATRYVVLHQPALAEEDVAQQAVSFLLQFLRSGDLQARGSHFAFAISRGVKRQLFDWAWREGMKDALLDRSGDILAALPAGESFERHAQLRHFLHRCVANGDLTDAELNLLIQFKLEGADGDDFENHKGSSPNALRQRLKRLLAKLRRLAH